MNVKIVLFTMVTLTSAAVICNVKSFINSKRKFVETENEIKEKVKTEIDTEMITTAKVETEILTVAVTENEEHKQDFFSLCLDFHNFCKEIYPSTSNTIFTECFLESFIPETNE